MMGAKIESLSILSSSCFKQFIRLAAVAIDRKGHLKEDRRL